MKFVGMWVTLKPSLVFNWVTFLGSFRVPLMEKSYGKFKQQVLQLSSSGIDLKR